MTMTDSDDWVQRYATAIENAVDAPTGRSRNAYLDLAGHYWSMHRMVRGLPDRARAPRTGEGADGLLMRWAA
jgi:hypothetical protein